MKKEIFTASDGKNISLCVWDETEGERKGIVQIVHGMVEYAARYDDFAKYLNRSGFVVVGDDHRAHGDTDPDALGVAGEGDLFERTVKDELEITDMLKERYGLPLVLFGHNYGSFLTQRYLTIDTQKLAGVVLCGSALRRGASVSLGRSMAKRACKKHRDEPGVKLNNRLFKAYDKRFHEGKNAWLNRDLASVGRYNVDPYCNFICSNGFYYYLFNGLITIDKDDNSRIRTDLKMHITAGDSDPVGGCGKSVVKLYDKFVELGLNPSLRLYSGARHEIINETNKSEVYCDLLYFFNSCVEPM